MEMLTKRLPRTGRRTGGTQGEREGKKNGWEKCLSESPGFKALSKAEVWPKKIEPSRLQIIQKRRVGLALDSWARPSGWG